jgi:hypothetical protein
VLYCAVLCCAVLCCTIRAVLCCAVAVLCCAVLWLCFVFMSCPVRFCPVRCSAVFMCCAVLCCAVLRCVAVCCRVLVCCAVVCCAVVCCAVGNVVTSPARLVAARRPSAESTCGLDASLRRPGAVLCCAGLPAALSSTTSWYILVEYTGYADGYGYRVWCSLSSCGLSSWGCL